MKADPYSIKRRARPEKVFTFDDGQGFECHLNLRRFGVTGSTAIEPRASEMCRKHVTGSGPLKKDGTLDTESPAYVAPEFIGMVDGEPVELTYATCVVVATIELAQTEWEDDSRYTFKELALMCASDRVAFQMMEASNWVGPDDPTEDDGQGNQVKDGDRPSLNTA